jgi:hypothetical protein
MLGPDNADQALILVMTCPRYQLRLGVLCVVASRHFHSYSIKCNIIVEFARITFIAIGSFCSSASFHFTGYGAHEKP